jgi:hypothetical protein
MFARLEWHCAKSARITAGINRFVHKPRIWWYARKWQRQQIGAALSHFEAKIYAQNGEDGILAEIFRRIGVGSGYAVECGIGDGTECCTRTLCTTHTWRGLLIEGCPALAAKAQRLYAAFSGVKVIYHFITVETILDLFQDYQVPDTPDLLVIDIDGNDYWVWERILLRYRPRVVVMEYNARWVPPVQWVMPYNAQHRWDGSVFFGASLTSLAQLGALHGYVLVGCESWGINVFFVQQELLEDRFPDAGYGVAHHYAPPRYGYGFGHPMRMPVSNT